ILVWARASEHRRRSAPHAPRSVGWGGRVDLGGARLAPAQHPSGTHRVSLPEQPPDPALHRPGTWAQASLVSQPDAASRRLEPPPLQRTGVKHRGDGMSTLGRWGVRGPMLLGLGLLGTGCVKLLRIPDGDLPWNEALGRLLGTNVHQLTLDEQERVLLSHIDQGLRDPISSPYFLIGVVGCALWTAAYYLLVRQAARDKVHSLPLLAIC